MAVDRAGAVRLDVLQPRRLDYALGWAKPLFNASEHKGLFGQRQTLRLPGPIRNALAAGTSYLSSHLVVVLWFELHHRGKATQ